MSAPVSGWGSTAMPVMDRPRATRDRQRAHAGAADTTGGDASARPRLGGRLHRRQTASAKGKQTARTALWKSNGVARLILRTWRAASAVCRGSDGAAGLAARSDRPLALFARSTTAIWGARRHGPGPRLPGQRSPRVRHRWVARCLCRLDRRQRRPSRLCGRRRRSLRLRSLFRFPRTGGDCVLAQS